MTGDINQIFLYPIIMDRCRLIDMMRLAQFKNFVQKHRILLNKNMATGLDICRINSILFDCFQHLNEMNQTTSKQQNVLS